MRNLCDQPTNLPRVIFKATGAGQSIANRGARCADPRRHSSSGSPVARSCIVTTFYFAAGGLLSLAAMCAAILFAAVCLRNPLAPRWLQTEAAATGAGLVLTVGICLAVAYAVSTLEGANMTYRSIAPLVAGVPTVTTLLLWKVLNIGDRLARAEAGHSSFRRTRSPDAAQVTSAQIADAA